MERSEVEELVRELVEEYLPEQRRQKMLSYKAAPPPEAEGAHLEPGGDMGQDEMPEECRMDLDAVLG
jgi:hypothetical protein